MEFSKETLKGNMEAIILKILHHKSQYGYELIQAIKKESGGVFDFKEGTVYPLLYRMEEKQFLTSEKHEAPSGKMRRYYFITEKGKKFLVKKTDELKSFIGGLEKLSLTK